MPPLPRPFTTTAARQLRSSLCTTSRQPQIPRGLRPFTTSPLLPPLNLPKWLSQNSHLLQPPINNHCITTSPLTVMIVGGPNARTDYHINPTPEFFYQYKGTMLLKTMPPDHNNGDGEPNHDIYINEGDIFLLPANIPHNPVRFANTVGIVIEQPRPADALDRLRWYCQNCGGKVYETPGFYCTDLGTQVKEAVGAFGAAEEETRRCGKGGEICETAPKEEVMEAMRRGAG